MTTEILPLPKFWSLVATLGWKLGADSKALKRIVMDTLTVEEALAADKIFSGLHLKLSTVLENYEETANVCIGLSDDSFSDMVAHIIGLGEKEYTETLANPQRALTRARKDDFCESFAYVWPDAEDYAKRGNAAAFKTWAERNRANYAAMTLNPMFLPVHAEGALVVAAMDLILSGNVEGFLAQQAAVEAAVQKATGYAKKLVEEIGAFDTNPWAIKNLFSDVAEAFR